LPTPIFQTVVALAKGTERLAYKVTLLTAEVRTLQAANKALSKRWRAKKNRIHQGGALTVEDAHNILAQEKVDKQIQHSKRSRGVRQNKGQSGARRYGNCGKTGYNTRTCKEDVDMSSLSDSK
jgi:hypothetical protein